MSETLSDAAAAAIRARMAAIERERQRYHPTVASGEDLDLVGKRAGVERKNRGDLQYRVAIIQALAATD